MIRFAVLCFPLFLLGCASTSTSNYSIDSAARPTPRLAVPVDSRVAPEPAAANVAAAHRLTDADALASTDADALGSTDADARASTYADALAIEPAAPVEPAPTWMMPPAAAEDESLHGSRFTVKAGWYSTDGTDTLDDGYIINVSWMRYFTKILAIELEGGYLSADGDGDSEVWGIPLMVNGRINVPIWVLDVYGGLGIGTVYYDFTADSGGSDASGWVLAGDAFIGSTINLGDAMALGLEVKYYDTDSISDVGGGLDALAVMLTLGFSR